MYLDRHTKIVGISALGQNIANKSRKSAISLIFKLVINLAFGIYLALTFAVAVGVPSQLSNQVYQRLTELGRWHTTTYPVSFG
jgi:hypothetical protein